MTRDILQTSPDLNNFIVYIVESFGYYKIGFAKDVDHRISDMQVGNPAPIKLIHSFEVSGLTSTRKAESFLHSLFLSKRVNGEWFCLTDLDVEFCKTISGYQNDCFLWSSGLSTDKPFVLFEGLSKKGFKITVTDKEALKFLQTAWRRQSSGKPPFSREFWMKTSSASRMGRDRYEAMIQIVSINGLISDRSARRSGRLNLPPHEALSVILAGAT